MDINEYSAKKLKELRERKNITQQELAEALGVQQQQIARYENNQRKFKQDLLCKLADYFNVSINDFFPNTNYDNAETIKETIRIAIYGSIKAGIPLENQNDIVEYMNIPKDWIRGNKSLFGLKVSGDSMNPKYQDGEVVIFEQTNDLEDYKNKDCAIMINHTESTFKKVLINDTGIILVPYNTNYDMMPFTNEEIENLPIWILGRAIKKVSDIE